MIIDCLQHLWQFSKLCSYNEYFKQSLPEKKKWDKIQSHHFFISHFIFCAAYLDVI